MAVTMVAIQHTTVLGFRTPVLTMSAAVLVECVSPLSVAGDVVKLGVDFSPPPDPRIMVVPRRPSVV